MLRITLIQNDDATVTLKLEGRIHDAWVGLLERECGRLRRGRKRILLDCGHVSFVDAEGLALLRRLSNGHLRVIHCPAFIADLLEGGDHR